MSQLQTLLWLRYTIFRNSFRSRGEVVRRVFNAILFIVPMFLSLGVGVAVFAGIVMFEQFRKTVLSAGMMTIQAALLFLILISQTTGSSANFDPRRFVLFPIRLTKLFLLNLIAGLSEFSIIMVLPSVAGILLGLGVAYGHPIGGLIALILAIVWINGLFICSGMVFSWLLSGRKRSREIVFALLIGLITVTGQVLPQFFMSTYGTSAMKWLRPYQELLKRIFSWTPIGVWSDFFIRIGNGQVAGGYLHMLGVAFAWIALVWCVGYFVFLRLATNPGASSSSTRDSGVTGEGIARNFISLRIPFVSGQTAAVVAKELKYLARNPASYLTGISSLIIPLIMFRSSFSRGGQGLTPRGDTTWWISVWVSYVFMANLHYFGGLFAYDSGGFRQYLLAPVKWVRLLIGKNISAWIMVITQISLVLIGVQILDHNLNPEKIYLAFASTLIAMAIYSMVGNFLSIYFPYRLNFGFASRRGSDWSGLNLAIQLGLLAGVAGLLLLPVGLGWYWKSLLIRDLALAGLVLLCWPVYGFMLKFQVEKLDQRRFRIAEALTRKTEKI